MTEYDGEHGARHVRLADLPQAEIGDHIWHPVRRALGATGFGVGAYSAARAGDVLVGTHDETGLGSNRHEELYVVLPGRALFEIDGRSSSSARRSSSSSIPRRAWRAGARRRDERPRHRRRAGSRGAGALRALVHGADGRRPARQPRRSQPQGSRSSRTTASSTTSSPASGRSRASSTWRHGTSAARSPRTSAHGRGSRTTPTSTRCARCPAPCRRGCGSARSTSSRRERARSSCSSTQASRIGRMWDRAVGRVGGDPRVIRLDLRGFGRSDLPDGTFSHAGDVLAVLDALGVERAVLVGRVVRRPVALDLAAPHPDRVAGLVLAGAGLPDHEWSAEIEAFGAGRTRRSRRATSIARPR